jgi:hypothetical protein
MTTELREPSFVITVLVLIARILLRRVASSVGEALVTKSRTGTAVQPMLIGQMSLNLIVATVNCSFVRLALCEATILSQAQLRQHVYRLKVLGRTYAALMLLTTTLNPPACLGVRLVPTQQAHMQGGWQLARH